MTQPNRKQAEPFAEWSNRYPWRETVARHRAAYEAHLWELDHPDEVAWLDSPEGERFKTKIREWVNTVGFCRSHGCPNLADHTWGQCHACYQYDLQDFQTDWENEQIREEIE